MKKIIITVNLVLLSLLISGCGCSKKEEENVKTLKCEYSDERPPYFKFEADSQLYYNDNNEVLKSIDNYSYKLYENGDKSILDEQSQLIDWLYENYKGIDYYDIEKKEENDNLLLTITIDYKKIDMEKLIENDEFYSVYYENEQIPLQDMIDLYEKQGYKCDN